MASKLVKGSAIILIGNIIFRIGGYVQRFIMATLLGPAAYGIWGLTTPFQGIFQTLSAAGLPPAIAKYVSEYTALEEEDLARQTIFTALKIMLFLGIFFGFVMVFIAAPIFTDFFGKPEALLPLRAVGLMTPFSVIVGAFRGAFQGVYKMEYILYTRAIEQIVMILAGTAVAAASAVYIFKRYMNKYIAPRNPDFDFPLKAELKLAGRLVKFAIPVSITGLAEMGIYSICTFIMGAFLTAAAVGYFTAADPIARLPLIVSISLATTILPAVSEAYALKDRKQLQKYVNDAYKYGMVLVIPMCVGIAVFAKEILGLVYFTNGAYMNGGAALSILVIGMTFYSIYSISGSILQGIGNPRIPMYILLLGCVATAFLGYYFIPIYGIAGGALATTITSLGMMIPMVIITHRVTKTHAPYMFLLKITIASIIMGLPALVLPDNILGLIAGLIICPIIYVVFIVLLRTLSHEDIEGFRGLAGKFGPMKKYANKFLDVLDKYSYN